jgi:hypothetical protein
VPLMHSMTNALGLLQTSFLASKGFLSTMVMQYNIDKRCLSLTVKKLQCKGCLLSMQYTCHLSLSIKQSYSFFEQVPAGIWTPDLQDHTPTLNHWAKPTSKTVLTKSKRKFKFLEVQHFVVKNTFLLSIMNFS